MTEEQLVAKYPRLWHMAHDGAWPSIRDYGLMSAAALVDAYDVDCASRDTLLRCNRRKSVPLTRNGLPGAVLRDQKPMSDAALKRCLDGMSPTQWYELLNSRCFFWLSRDRVRGLLQAYRSEPQTVLTIETRGLVAAHRESIWLSPINSGSTLFNPQQRGAATFKRVGDFPFAQRATTRRPKNNAVELLVEHSVPDIAKHVLAVYRVRDGQKGEIWRSDRAGPDDHP
jgi:hypothetical protein